MKIDSHLNNMTFTTQKQLKSDFLHFFLGGINTAITLLSTPNDIARCYTDFPSFPFVGVTQCRQGISFKRSGLCEMRLHPMQL